MDTMEIPQGINGYKTQAEVIGRIREYVEDILEEYGFSDIVTIVEIQLIGSRINGTARPDSDLDARLFYSGYINEDFFFNILNVDFKRLSICDIPVDINPSKYDENYAGADKEYSNRPN